MKHDINRICAGAYLNEAMRRAKSPLAHQRRYADWLLNNAISRTQAAIASYLELKQPKRPLGQIGLFE